MFYHAKFAHSTSNGAGISRGEPPKLRRARALERAIIILKHAPPRTGYHAKFGHFRSNGTSVRMQIRRKMELLRSAFQGYSMSLEPTRIDLLPMISY